MTGRAIVERNILHSNEEMAVLLLEFNGTMELRNNEICAPKILGAFDAAIFGRIFNGIFIVENNVISSGKKGINIEFGFTGDFQSNNNVILSEDEKIQLK